ncbi:NifB/NifX family molybdenum-iron cluster-binding protein [Thermophagus sp. OGC60D27]|uniref:NifB/NifX family molybdenum-iron cluster-binding protein n=1 Tax=Thermophagus sp. OGC60D27 TaxID=3458415 RepID=UPI00403840EA
MKTLITSTTENSEGLFDKRFGRAAWFCVLDEETGETSFLKNENAEGQSGAGTKTAEKVVELGVEKVISGDFGPKAKKLLEKFGVQMVIINEDLKVIDLINRIKG